MISQKIPRAKLPRLPIVERNAFILENCAGKKVLHVGCTDAPFTESKYESGDLLHMQLLEVAEIVVGIDIDAASLEFLRERGVENLHHVDAHKAKGFLEEAGFKPDVIVAGEVLEHLDAPQKFLAALSETMDNDTRLMISVPNAFWLEGFIHVMLGKEKIHPEHVAYYSYSTIKQLLERCDLEVDTPRACHYKVKSAKKKFTDMLLRPFLWISPHFAPGLVLTAKRTTPSD